MFTIFLRAFILYVIMLVTLRGMGKHQLGQFQPYEFVMAILIADLASTPMSDVSTPLLHGVLPIAALFITHGIITLLCMRFDKIRAIISGKPVVVIANGVIDRKTLTRLCFGLSDLLEGLRIAGILDPKDLGTAVIESNGTISAFPKSQCRPATAGEAGISTPKEGLPLMLILDGRIQPNNLKLSGQSRQWLCSILSPYNLSVKEILLASLDAEGMLHVQDDRGSILRIRAVQPQELNG